MQLASEVVDELLCLHAGWLCSLCDIVVFQVCIVHQIFSVHRLAQSAVEP